MENLLHEMSRKYLFIWGCFSAATSPAQNPSVTKCYSQGPVKTAYQSVTVVMDRLPVLFMALLVGSSPTAFLITCFQKLKCLSF